MSNASILATINNKLNNILSRDVCEQDIFIPTYIPKKFSKKILVISGGGIGGISFIGALNALYESNILQQIEIFAGTSVGALILFLHLIGYKPNMLFEFINAFDLNKLKAVSITLFLESYGLDTGDKIIKMLIKFMELQNVNQSITFAELFQKTQKTLIITSVNINSQSAEYFSHETHPSMSVLQAVRMSISVPFIFCPVQYNGCLYVDGACIDNFPIKQFADRKHELLGLYITPDKERKKNIHSLDEFALNLINSMMNGAIDMTTAGYEPYIIGINTNKINSIDFDITSEMKKELYNAGSMAVHNYLETNLQ